MSSRKLKLIAFICGIAIMSPVFLLETPLETINLALIEKHNPADLVFSYDFDDGNLSDWSWFAIDDGIPYNEYPGNVSVANGSMTMGGEHWNIAYVNSSVAYGSWSFDVFVVDNDEHEIVIPFILIEYTTDVYLKQAYILQIVTGYYPGFLIPGTEYDQPRLQTAKISLYTGSPTGRSLVWTDQFDTDDIWGWKNFTITREDDGQFYIYMNGVPVLDFKDNQHTTCNYFAFSSRVGPAFDNLFVYDNVIYDAAPPEWEPAPTNQFIALGEDFRYDLNASDFSGVDAWAVNDTTNFAIDSDGVITNIVDLAVGTFGLNVSVSDTGGFTRSATFRVIVERPDAPLPDITLYLVLGGGGVIIVALVVLFMRKR